MSTKNDIVNPLEHLPKLNCFKVPEGYFNRLQHSIELRLAVESKPFEDSLSALKNTTAFSLPQNYFDSLANRIAEQTSAQPSILDAAPVNGFTVPNGYFDRLYLRIADRISAGTVAAVRPWWQPAPVLRPVLAFAGVGAVIGVAVWAVFFTLPVSHTNGLAMAQGNRNILIQPIVKNNDTSTPTTYLVSPPAKQGAKQAARPALTADMNDLINITGGFGDELNLSEIPTTANTTNDGLVEILAEDVDIAEVINAGL